TVGIARDYFRVHVAFAADRGRIAEAQCNAFDRGGDVAFSGGFACGCWELRKRYGSQDRTCPGAEILGRNIFPRNRTKIGVYVIRRHCMNAVSALVLEKVLPWQILASAHDARDPSVGDRESPDLSGLATKSEA